MVTFINVKTIHNFLNGSYDYSFFQTEKEDQIIWVISDCSNFHSRLSIHQPYHHEKEIERQSSIFRKEVLPTLRVA
jgi:hypothetical protein